MKKIIIDQETIESSIEEFTLALREQLAGKLSATKLKFEREINPSVKLQEEDKAKVYFSAEAEKKQAELIQQCEKEVGWHGIVRRLSEKEFIVDDILVFPQVVTGATVTPDAAEYIDWQNSLSDDEFNNMRFHGHSHVNMGVSPSGTDTGFQDNLLQNVRDFYIFLIINKRNEVWLNIYDVENNVLYENSDISYEYYQTPEAAWAKEELKKVRVQSYIQTWGAGKNKNAGAYGGQYAGFYGSNYYGSGHGAREYDDLYQGYYGREKNKSKGVTYDE